jgi:hypothetical protein
MASYATIIAQFPADLSIAPWPAALAGHAAPEGAGAREMTGIEAGYGPVLRIL